MKIIESLLKNNDCYKANRQISVKGLMLHSVGCSQPKAEVFVNSWNKSGVEKAVHGFIDGNTGDVFQTLPWNWRGWHCASGANGSGNNTHIGVEMCEPATITYTGGASWVDNNPASTKTVVMRTYKTAVELFAFLCGEFKLDPLADGVIISHSEGCKRGIASNHADVEHIWSKFGLTMNQFRQDVKTALIGAGNASGGVSDGGGTVTPTDDADGRIWAFLTGKGLSACAVAGVMGNLYAESGLRPDNLQNTYEKSLGMNDAEYTAAVDKGAYNNFVKDSAGYGLAQWTFWSRKQALLDFAKAAGASIGDLSMQLNFLWKELQGYTNVMKTLQTATSVREASDVVLCEYERPANMGEEVKVKRAGYGQTYFDKFAEQTPASKFPSVPFTVQVIIPDLNYRAEPSMSGAVKGQTGKGVFTILEVNNGWGRLKSGVGWIYLENPSYCTIQGTVAEVPKTPQKSIDEIAKEVIAGKWGNGQTRKDKLTAAGYNYSEIQARVNALLK
ncbi:MAG: phage tail tip lysozyme [Candidatus Fimivivens sp.]|nr:phage tail tip lysozyme [Candidatus Fimivivens sp.]